MAHVLLGDTLKCGAVCLLAGDGFVTIMEFEANLNPKTRKKIEEKLMKSLSGALVLKRQLTKNAD